MRLELKGQAVYITGRLTRYTSQRELERALRAGGATTTSDVNLTTTALIVGAGWTGKVQLAAARGLPILTEDHAAQLLAQGFIELEDAPAPAPVARDAAIGELRPALSGTPTPQAWSEILALLDRCPPEQLDELVDYVDAQTGRWDIPADLRWTPAGEDAAPQGDWNIQQPIGELRMTPFRWLVEMLKGADSPKHRVLRGLGLRGAAAKNADVVKLLTLPSLSRLTTLDLSANLSVTIWKRLYEAPCTHNLHTLALIATDIEHKKAIQAATDAALPALRTLRLSTCYHSPINDDLGVLFTTPWAARITSLELDRGGEYLGALTSYNDNVSSMPALKTLHLQLVSYFNKLSEQLPANVHPVETLSLGAQLSEGHAANMRNLFDRAVPGFSRLDLSRMAQLHEHSLPAPEVARIRDLLADALLRTLPNSPVVQGISTIKLGRWYTPRLADALAQNNTEVIP